MQERKYDVANKISSAIYILADRTYGKYNYHIDEVFFLVVGVVIAFFTIGRCFFGIEITDEAYYVADAYSLFQGNLPFAYNTSSVAGMSLIAYPFMWLFRIISPNDEGIFLYMRLCYIAFKFLVIFFIYVILRGRYSRRVLIPACTILIGWCGSYIFNFSYNTSSFWLMLLACVIVYSKYKIVSDIRFRFLSIAGVLSAFSVFAHPMHIGSVLTLCILILLVSEKGNKFTNLVAYVAGGVVLVAMVLFWVAAQTGMTRLLNGIDVMLFHRLLFARDDLWTRCIDFLPSVAPVYIVLIIGFVISMICYWLINKHFILGWDWKYRWLLSAVVVLIPMSIAFVLFGSPDCTLSYLGMLSFWIIIVILPIYGDVSSCFVVFPFFSFFVCEIVFPAIGTVLGRAYFMYPSIFILIILSLGYEKKMDFDCKTINGITLKILIGLLTFMVAIIVIACEYLYVYRDAPISQLDYRVSEGIYKGIYTTKENAENIIEVEEYIRENTSSTESISFRDNVPFGYLMSNGLICDTTTWDAMQYSYVVADIAENNPANMYRYYKNSGTIPDKYIYIDCGRDDIISCENPTFQFNKWRNSYYEKVDEKKINDRYLIYIYQYKGNFDGNYDYWINGLDN